MHEKTPWLFCRQWIQGVVGRWWCIQSGFHFCHSYFIVQLTAGNLRQTSWAAAIPQLSPCHAERHRVVEVQKKVHWCTAGENWWCWTMDWTNNASIILIDIHCKIWKVLRLTWHLGGIWYWRNGILPARDSSLMWWHGKWDGQQQLC